MMRLGVISAFPRPGEDWHAERIVRAARRRAEVDVLSPLDFAATIDSTGSTHGHGANGARGRPRLLVRGRDHRRYHALLTARAIGDEGDPELQLELYRTLTEDGALVVNDVAALTTAIDKFRTSWILHRLGLPTPRAAVSQRPSDAVRAFERLGRRVVAKPLYGSLGVGVELVTDEVQIAACLRRWRALYLQEYVDGGGRDVRAFVVGERVEAAIERSAPPGDFRTNLHQGGRARGVRLDAAAEALAVAAARAVGLDWAGVDLVFTRDGVWVLEVNGAPLFRGIYEATGRDMAEPIVEHALRLARGQEVAARAGA